jgi:hypothetical protein
MDELKMVFFTAASLDYCSRAIVQAVTAHFS